MTKKQNSDVYVRLLGGLGNQLFQYAMGRHLADEKGVDLVLDPRYVNRKAFVSGLAIQLFNVRARILRDDEQHQFPEWAWKLSRAVRRQWRPWLNFYHETEHGYDAGLPRQPTGTMISGFWQSHHYISQGASLLHDLSLVAPFNQSQQVFSDQIVSCNSVALHVRRGDYVSNAKALKKHGLCSDAYYQQAISLIKAKVKAPVFFVFSDDPVWVRSNLKLNNAVYLSDENFDQQIDLILISLCKHQIIANSSFSWWGAYLNQYIDKIVVSPTPWFDDKLLADAHMYPEGWLKVAK